MICDGCLKIGTELGNEVVARNHGSHSDSVSISGSYAIVGAYREDTNGSDSRAAYIYERGTTGAWTQKLKNQCSQQAMVDQTTISAIRCPLAGHTLSSTRNKEDTNGEW